MNEVRPVAVYNGDKQELIGLFSMSTLAIKYLFTVPNHSNEMSVYRSISKKTKVNGTRFSFRVAVRFANTEQTELLSQQRYMILNEYPEACLFRMKGFDDTAATLKAGSIKRMARKNEKIKNKQK